MKQINSLGSEVRAARRSRFRRGGTVLSGSVKTLWRMALGAVAALTLVAACVSPANAAVYTRFDSASALENWRDVHYPGTVTHPVGIMDGPGNVSMLGITRPSGGAAANNAFVYYTGSEGGIVDGKVADFEMSSVFSVSWGSQSESSTFGFMVRAQSAAYNAGGGGYYVAFSPKGGGTLTLFDSPTTHTANGTELKSVTLSLSKDANYLFKVSAIGSTISASVWSEDGNTLLAGLEFDEARVDAGYFGVRTGFGNTSVSQYIKDISVTVIPEPTTIGFILMGGTAMLMSLRRRQG